MAQSHRLRLGRTPKYEQEIRILGNPLDEDDSLQPRIRLTPLEKQREVLSVDDYQAPLTALSLQPNSHWLTVRRNLHRIRLMGFNNIDKQGRLPDLYLGFQMTRELKRAKDEIKNIDKEKDFQIVKRFVLPDDHGDRRVFKTSHVTADDALIYDRLGEEPLALQNLLFYFSKQEVSHGTVFWEFLNEVNHVLDLKRKRTALIERLRQIALSLAIIFYIFIGIMFCLMIISVVATATKLNDAEVQWMDGDIEGYSMDGLITR